MCIRHRLHRLRPSVSTAFRLAAALTTASFTFAAATFAITLAAFTFALAALAVAAAALTVTATAFAADSANTVGLAPIVKTLCHPPRRRVP